MARLFTKEKEIEGECFQEKKAFVGFIDDVPRRNRQCTIGLAKKRGFVQAVQVFPEIIELISASVAIIHTTDAYYVVCVKSATEDASIFFSYEEPEKGNCLYGQVVNKSESKGLNLELQEGFTDIVIKITQISNVWICYTKDKIYLNCCLN